MRVRDFPFHVLELRTAIDGIIERINSFGSGAIPAVAWIDIGTGRPRADVMGQLMDVVLGL